MKKILAIFIRDLRVNTRDFIVLYILVFPLLAAVFINVLTPGINDTTVTIGFIEEQNKEMEEYLADFAKIETFEDEEALRNRILKRDNILGILEDEQGENYILAQGNETEHIHDMVRVLKSYYDLDLDITNTTAEIIEFGETVPPLKKMLVNVIILMTSILAGMIIAINIVEEKTDNTVSAINVTTVSRLGFILGKSLMGVCASVFGTIALIVITGFTKVNVGQILVMVLTGTLLSLIVGFIQGINSDDFMTAAGGIKLLFLPVIGAVVGYEVLAEKWQVLFYWIPFYWTYKGNDAILSGEANWGSILGYTAIVLLLTAVVYAIVAPRIRKGLEQ